MAFLSLLLKDRALQMNNLTCSGPTLYKFTHLLCSCSDKDVITFYYNIINDIAKATLYLVQ